MGQIKTHGQEKREKEKDRDKKSCWGKKKKKVAGCSKKKARNYKEKAQATAQWRRQQQGKGTHVSPLAWAAPPAHRAVLGATGTALEPSRAPRDTFMQHQILQPSDLGSTVFPKSMPLPLASSPTNTTQVVFPALD